MMRYILRQLPPVGWQPSPDAQALDQIVVQINQWLRQSEPAVEWQVDPLLATLDPVLAADEDLAPYISPAGLANPFFLPHDGRLLQEAVWLRDISRWAVGDSFDKLAQAEALFDWTVRNIQLEADSNRAVERPWQTLLYGRGTAEQRAWVFALLCRQQGLDVVMLAIAPPATEVAAATPTKPQFWLPALVDEGQLYLFDTRLGLPIPGPNGQGVATLREVRENDALLRQLDLEGSPYPVTAEPLKNVVAYVVADPFDLTRRVQQVETKLTGDDQLALSVNASGLAERMKQLGQVSDVRIWDVPFQTLDDQLTLRKTMTQSARREAALKFEPFAWRPMLWKARTRQFQGRRQVADESKNTDPEDLIDDHGEATRLYMNKSIRPPDRTIAMSGEEERRILETAKLDATLWLGVMALDDKKYDVADHWLGRPELLAKDSPWSGSARYNLACAHEAQGRIDEAVALLEQDDSPQQQGNKLRAKWLRERPRAENESTAEKASE